MDSALITGGCGFVGRRFARRLLDEGVHVTVVDDLSTGLPPEHWPDCVRPRRSVRGHLEFVHEDVRAWMQRHGPEYDLVIHLAAVVGGRLTIEGDPLAVATDLAIDADFFNWLTAARTAPRKTIYFSSSAAYPIGLQSRENHVPLNESDIDFERDLIGQPDMTYGWSKLTGEFLAGFAARMYGLDVVCYRPFSGYAEEQDTTYPFPSILRRVTGQADPVIVWGSGEQERDFIHMEDVVSAVFATCDTMVAGAALNLGTGIATSFRSLAELACDVAGHDACVEVDPSKPEGVFSRVADATMMLRHYRPVIDLKAGVEMAMDCLGVEDHA